MSTFAEVGLNTNKWAQWRKEMLTTGTYDPNEWHTLNQYQRQWTQDTLNTMKTLSVNEDYKID